MPNKKDYPRIKISNDLRHKVLDAARVQRKNPTKSENALWQALRGKKLDGLKFRRQQPVGIFVVDFYNAPGHKLRFLHRQKGAICDREGYTILNTAWLSKWMAQFMHPNKSLTRRDSLCWKRWG